MSLRFLARVSFRRGMSPAGTAASPRARSGGQVIVIMVGGLFAIIAVLALIIDGGNAWARQRITQNGSDAAAEAGAVVMAERLAGVATPLSGWDLSVKNAITTSAGLNGISVPAAYYTDICGIPLTSTGTAALNADGTENLAVAAQVGNGFPTTTATTPDCPSLTVGPPAGVLVMGQQQVGTYLARVIGISNITVTTRAVAATGYLQGYCDASQGSVCAVLPVAVPVNTITCTAQNQAPLNTGVPYVNGNIYTVPLCSNSPGNLGWLDWTPPAGGTSELIQSILHPNNPAISLPSWQYVTSTGNVNSQGVEDAVRTYDGQIVLIPQFDATCGSTPTGTAVSGCSNLGGNGQNQWYHIPSFAYFKLCTPTMAGCQSLYGAYINGNNSVACNTILLGGGNGATSCLIGEFVDAIATGTIGPGVGGGTGSKAIGIQLIK